MSLRIRRGTESQRQATTFDLGEIVYTTDGKKLFVGDGVTVGGVNVLKTTAGSGLSWNDSTQQLDISGTNLSTSNIIEGTNLYFTTDRAQDAAASLFTHNVGHNNISFTYDDTLNKILATVSLDGVGIASVSADPSPSLGGNLILNTHNITGTGGIDITGNITATTINAKLGSNLDINSHNITGTGNINIIGGITSTTINAKLGSNLDINSHNITGTGNIDITGDITYTGSISNSIITTTRNYIDINENYGLIIQSEYNRVLSLNGITTGSFSDSPYLSINASRGSIQSPTVLEANDVVGSLVFTGRDDIGVFKTTGGIISTLSNTVDVTKTWPDSTLTIFTGNNSDTTYSKFTFSGNGVLNAPIFKLASYETLSLPSNPETGWMVFDSTTNQFKGWNGASWIILG